jgi:hypothetical protein
MCGTLYFLQEYLEKSVVFLQLSVPIKYFNTDLINVARSSSD